MKRVLVLGAGGFIGNHMSKYLVEKGVFVTGVDLKRPDFGLSACQRFIIGDLRSAKFVDQLFEDDVYDQVFQFAADMGGAGYIFSGENDASVMTNSCKINLNVLSSAKNFGCQNIFYSSSACVYPEYNQMDPRNPNCEESTAYPANPDSEYGWEKLFSERLYLSYARNFNMNVTIGRYHNIFGPLGTWEGGKEKAPAALCRKVAMAGSLSDSIEIWGDGEQTRSFLYIDDCLDATWNLVNSDAVGPTNIGSEEMVTINELARKIIKISQKRLHLNHVSGFQGVRGRCSENSKIEREIGWSPSWSLEQGLEKTYKWIEQQVALQANDKKAC